ncbi:unnamed protein product, partial [Iphiclides podalirius]
MDLYQLVDMQGLSLCERGVCRSASGQGAQPPATQAALRPRWHVLQGKLIQFCDGKPKLLYKDYLYFKHYKARSLFRWTCTSWAKCKAYLYVNEEFVIQQVFRKHNHPPRKLHCAPDGTYFKV